jgi:type VI secretion system protein ImpF
MAKIKTDQPLLPSVLDRLLDDNPGVSRDVDRSRHQVLTELKQAVRRDLENLLNTRRRCLAPPPHLKELEQSLVAYGIPDFTGANMGAAETREQFRRMLETVIRTYEPRFKTVKVFLLDNVEPLDRTLRFRIDGLLYAEPAPEAVVFGTSLEPVTGSVQVKGAGQ